MTYKRNKRELQQKNGDTKLRKSGVVEQQTAINENLAKVMCEMNLEQMRTAENRKLQKNKNQ